MANRYRGKMIVVDTAATQVGGDNPSTNMPAGELFILAIKWIGTQTSGKDIAQNDDLKILWRSKSGTAVIECRAQEATPHQEAYSVEFGCPGWGCAGLYVEEIDGGELQIFLA